MNARGTERDRWFSGRAFSDGVAAYSGRHVRRWWSCGDILVLFIYVCISLQPSTRVVETFEALFCLVFVFQ